LEYIESCGLLVYFFSVSISFKALSGLGHSDVFYMDDVDGSEAVG